MGTLRLHSSSFFRARHPRASGAVLPSPDLASYSAEQVAFARQAWTMKAEEEHRSACVFAEALGLLADADVPLDVLGAIHRVVGDELRHTELFLELAGRFGAAPPANRACARSPAPLDPEGRRARGLEILAIEGAMGETLSSAVFAAAHAGAREPCARGALGLVLRDEVGHARVFREALQVLLPTVDAEELARLRRQVSAALGGMEQRGVVASLRRLEEGVPFDPAWAALGVVPPERRVEAFYGTLERRVLPHLDALGLDGTRGWRDRYRVEPS